MTLGEFFGYSASLLVFMTFYMRTMVPLRIIGICSNIAFLAYAIHDGLIPIMILHAMLLPLNVLRLRELRSQIAVLQESWTGGVSLNDLLPFMTQRQFRQGEVLFRNDDESHEMYFILDGAVRLEEIDKTLGAGELFGEISMFSPGRRRTATAVCETDGDLLQIDDQKVLELYGQNPSFGFFLMRLITGRLIENQSTLMALAKGHPAESTGVDPASVAPVTGDTLRAHKPSSGRLKRLRVATSPYFLGAVFVTAAIVIYAGWSIGPYLQSVFFRDAAVTTWVHIATSPIKGNLNNVSLTPGQRVGSDGRIALVRNEQADRSEVDRSQAEIVRAQAKFGELETYLTRIQLLDSEFRERTVGYAVNFKKVLAIEITGGKREVAHLDKQLKLMRDLAERKVSLARRGAASRTSADNALAETKALGRTRAERLRDIALSQQRLDAAKGSVFLTGDGRVPEWAYRSQDTLRLEIDRTTMALADAKSDRAKARITADAARELFQTTSESSINAPAGSLVWSVFANNGQAVEIGTQIVEWIDCREILVDVPTSDVEIPLLRAGSPADVVIEGEAKARKGTVLMTRGGASSLNDSQLAAVAKGRRSGTSHAIVNLEVTPGDAQDCPVGRAASVNFPEINIIDLIRARLRF